jgi:predicted dehydrogenase
MSTTSAGEGNDVVKVGIVGLGFMGLTHLRAYRDHPRARLVAVSDQIEKRLAGDLSGVQGNFLAKGERYDFSGVSTYTTIDGIVDDPEVELLSVCLPSPFHREVTERALARGKHVLCEKPMALSAEDVDAMVAAAAASRGTLMVAQCIRFWPDYRKAREIAISGEIGRVVSARFSRLSPLPTWGGWLLDPAMSGGMILDLSIHDIDFAQHLLGMPETVRATGAADIAGGGGYDYFQGTLSWGDVSVLVEAGWLFRGAYPFAMSFDIVCEGGVLSYHSGMNRSLTLYRKDGKREAPKLAPGDGYAGEIDYLLRAIAAGTRPELSPPEESAASVKLGLLLRESRETGGKEIAVASRI